MTKVDKMFNELERDVRAGKEVPEERWAAYEKAINYVEENRLTNLWDDYLEMNSHRTLDIRRMEKDAKVMAMELAIKYGLSSKNIKVEHIYASAFEFETEDGVGGIVTPPLYYVA